MGGEQVEGHPLLDRAGRAVLVEEETETEAEVEVEAVMRQQERVGDEAPVLEDRETSPLEEGEEGHLAE